MGRVRAARPRARVLVVPPPLLFEQGIEELLRQEPGLEIVGRERDPLVTIIAERKVKKGQG